MRYAYIHGFASSPLSSKGVALSELFEGRSLPFDRPDLNVPSFGELTFTKALGAIDEMAARHPGEQWCLIGSSMGGYLSALWSERNPEKVHRLLLLCPGFNMVERWLERVMDPAEVQAWERTGYKNFVSGAGVDTPVHWGFIEDARRHPAIPEVSCETVIIHGTLDDVVPIEGSRLYVEERPEIRMIEVEDEHRLVDHVHVIARTALEHFGLE